MSIARMTAVWQHSEARSNARLLLLKLADNADDNGYCWPGIEHLAKTTRLSKQTVIRLTKKLEEIGELYVSHNRRTGNKYIVLVGLSEEMIAQTLKNRLNYSDEKISNILVQIKLSLQKYQNVTSEVTHVVLQPPLSVKESSIPDANASGGDTAPPPKPPKPRKTRTKPKTPVPKAVRVFRDNTHRFPAKSWWDDVVAAVGEETENLEFWGQVVKAYVGLGWNPTNVTTMLDFYKRREIPELKYGNDSRDQQKNLRPGERCGWELVPPTVEQIARDRAALRERDERRRQQGVVSTV